MKKMTRSTVFAILGVALFAALVLAGFEAGPLTDRLTSRETLIAKSAASRWLCAEFGDAGADPYDPGVNVVAPASRGLQFGNSNSSNIEPRGDVYGSFSSPAVSARLPDYATVDVGVTTPAGQRFTFDAFGERKRGNLVSSLRTFADRGIDLDLTAVNLGSWDLLIEGSCKLTRIGDWSWNGIKLSVHIGRQGFTNEWVAVPSWLAAFDEESIDVRIAEFGQTLHVANGLGAPVDRINSKIFSMALQP